MGRSLTAAAACGAISAIALVGCLLIDPFPSLAAAPGDESDASNTGDSDVAGGACSPGSTRACSRTTCRGAQRCNAQGQWDPCDAREASFEICSTPLSESCIGDGGCTGDPTWALALGDGLRQRAVAVAVDATGHVYVAGSAQGKMPQLAIEAVSESQDSFVAKLTPEGNVEWARILPYVLEPQIAVTGTGVVVAGTLVGTVTPAGCPAVQTAGGSDLVLVRYDADGRCIVAAGFGDPSVQTVTGVAVDRTKDDVLVVGRGSGTVQLDGPDGGVVLSTTGTAGYYVRLDANLRALHGRLIESTGRLLVNGVTSSAAGTAVVFGTFSGELFGEPADRLDDGFTLIISPSGALSLVSTFGWPIRAAAFDGSDRFLLLGDFSGTMDLRSKNGPLLEATRPNEPFLVRRRVNDLSDIEAFALDVPIVPRGVAADSAGQVLVIGDHGITEAGAPESTDLFVGKYDVKTLTPIWTRVMGDGLSQKATAVAADPLGSVVVAGELRGAIDLGPGRPPLAANGPASVNGDALVMKLAP